MYNDIIQVDMNEEMRLLEKYSNYYVLLDYWLKLLEDGKELSIFFSNRKYKNIAIYGLGVLGKHLKKQLENTDINVIYVVDSGNVEYDKKIFNLKKKVNELPKVDVIVVTPLLEYETIKDYLNKEVFCDIVSLEEVILSI